MYDEPRLLLFGLATGICFGVLLQKGQVAKFQKILGQFLLKDWTVLKIMATAIAVGTLGVHALIAGGQAELHIQTAALARVIIGGVLFGAGLVIFGLCPGTAVAACGEGRRDAMAGVIGMLVGAGAYVAAFPVLLTVMKSLPDFGKVTLPQMLGAPPWLWAIGLASCIAVALAILERIHPRGQDSGRIAGGAVKVERAARIREESSKPPSRSL